MNNKFIIIFFGLLHMQSIIFGMDRDLIKMHVNMTTKSAVLYIDNTEKRIFHRFGIDNQSALHSNVDTKALETFLPTYKNEGPFDLELTSDYEGETFRVTGVTFATDAKEPLFAHLNKATMISIKNKQKPQIYRK